MKAERYLSDIAKRASEGRDIAIYGVGKVGLGLYSDLQALGIRIKCFIVSSKMGQPAAICQEAEGESIPVMQVDEVPDIKELEIVLGVSLGKVSGIIDKLNEYGILNYILLCQDYIDTILEEFKVPKLEITTVIGCAVNCKYCPQKILLDSYWKGHKERAREMSFSTFCTCINKLPLNTQIYFAGMAEPFLNKECINMIRYATDRGYRVGVYTTCVGLSLQDCRQLVDMPIESVILHVPDEESYAHIITGDEYWDVVEMLLSAVKQDGTPFVDSGSCQGTPLEEFMVRNKDRIRVETYLHDRAGNLSTDEGKLESCEYISGDIYCYHSGERLDHNILLPDGSVVLCCMDYGMKHTIGNLLQETYEEIMEGDLLTDIRKALKDNTQEILCRRCTYAVEHGMKDRRCV